MKTLERLSHYRLLEKIGEGGMGVVWRALDTRLGREVAIKLLSERPTLDSAGKESLLREARALAALDHPGIVTVYSIEESDDLSFLVMELVHGTPLGDLISSGGLSLKEFLRLAVSAADAIAAAHERGVCHGDLKPGNILVTDGGQVKVLDFGLARLRRPEPAIEPSERSTQSHLDTAGLAGTLPYMAPEQAEGRTADVRSDLFSLGTLMYEMATGRRPFRGRTPVELLASILRDSPQPVARLNPEMPRQCERLIARCLEKAPERRPESARALCRDLEALLRDSGSLEREPTPSIAVLPFADMSSQKDQEYFCEGIAEEIINALTKIDLLRVASRTSSFQFKSANMDSREIADRLGVSALLEGSVRKAGDRLRITAQLVGAADGCHLWSERYDRELKDIFAIQEEIAQSIADALELTLSPRERRAIKQVATRDVEAYEHYLRGRKFYYQYGRRGIELAQQMFQRAIECDPSYALAYAGIADCCAFIYGNADHSAENLRRADEASRKALELDPDLAEAHASRGVVLSFAGSHDEAERSFESAIALGPRLFEAHYFYARDCFARGRPEQAIEQYEKASELRPDDYQAPLLAAQIYDDVGRRAEAAASRRRGIERAEQRLGLDPDDVRAMYMAANAMIVLGERERGLTWASRARAIEPDEPMLLYNLACIHALAGDPEAALECLETAVDLGFAFRKWLEQDSNLDAIRADPRYGSLMDRIPRS